MSVSKRLYEDVAAGISGCVNAIDDNPTTRDHMWHVGARAATTVLAKHLATCFYRDNNRFSKDRFFRACGLPELADN